MPLARLATLTLLAGSLLLALPAPPLRAQTPGATPGPRAGAAPGADQPATAAGRGQGRGQGGFTSPPSDPAKLLFREGWTMPMQQPMVQSSIANEQLTLHIYGNADEVRKTMHPTEGYTYTGEATTNWAITVSDK